MLYRWVTRRNSSRLGMLDRSRRGLCSHFRVHRMRNRIVGRSRQDFRDPSQLQSNVANWFALLARFGMRVREREEAISDNAANIALERQLQNAQLFG